MKLAFLACILVSTAFAQVGVSNPVIVNGVGQPLPGATFATCTNNPGATLVTPCGEAGNSLQTTYTTAALSTPCTSNPATLGPLSGTGCTNPGLSDAYGNAVVFAAGGGCNVTNGCWYEVYGNQITATAYPLLFPASNNLTAPGPIGTTTPSIVDAYALNAVLYVGANIVQWSGSDIGAQINSAYAALPAAGGQIVVEPKTGGGCYAYTTPITFTTAGKFVIIQGAVSNNSNASSIPGGSCLNFTPSSGTALTFDIDASGVGSGNAMGAGMRDITLSNNLCITNGGCGGTAIGISTGTVGCGSCMFSNDSIEGFNEGMSITDNAGWGIVWLNTSFVWNATGIYYNTPGGHELDKFYGGILNTDGTAVNLNVGDELAVFGGHLDNNTTCGVSMGNNSTLHLIGVHYENTGGTNLPTYSCGTSTSSVLDISGGSASEDATTGTNSTPWFKAGVVHADGLFLASSGRVETGGIFSASTSLSGINVSSKSYSTLIGANPLVNNFVAAVVTYGGDGARVPYVGMPEARFPLRTAPSDIQTTGFGDCYGDSTANALLCSFNNDTPTQVTRWVDNGPVYNHSGAALTSPHTVRDFCILGTSCVVTLAGTAAFSTSSSFVCVASDKTGANPIQVAYPSDGAHVTFTGTGTDNLAYICVGN